MISELIEELQSLEEYKENDRIQPVLYINVPDGNGNVLTVMLRQYHAQGKSKSPCHAMLLLIKAFRDGTIKSVSGRHRPNEASLTHSGSHDLDERITNIEEAK